MATNSSRGNPIGARDGPQAANPNVEPVGDETKEAVLTEEGAQDPTGEHAAGQDATADSATTEAGTEEQAA
ncbi:hypothetical protein QBC35DRAFT_365313, partial [Podospora australis]